MFQIKSCQNRESVNAHKIVLEKFTKRFEEAALEENTAVEQINDDNIVETIKNRKLLHNMIKEFHAKKDMERLAKLLKRREHLDEKQNKHSHIDLPGDVDINNNINNYNKTESESKEEMKTTLEKYKKRVSELEPRTKNSVPYKDFEDDYFDNDKLNKAIDLIKKIESTLTDSGDIEASSQKSINSEGNLLNELLKSRKNKRASLSDVVERNLLRIYNILADEQVKRQRFEKKNGEHGTVFLRQRRAIDKKSHDRYAPISSTVKKLNKNEERKQLLERTNKGHLNNKRLSKLALSRKKNRKLESQDDNFYGFEKLPRLENFPTGDVHVELESSLKKDFLDVNVQDQLAPNAEQLSFGVRTEKSINPVKFPENNEEVRKFPDSYSELYNIRVPDIKNDFKNKHAGEKVVEIKNQQSKNMEGTFDYDGFNPNFPEDENSEFLRIFNNNDGNVPENDYLKIPSIESDRKRKTENSRQKRNIQDINEILNNEMIFEDDNNLKDCECRSTRKVADFQKDFEKMSRKKRDTSAIKLNGKNYNDTVNINVKEVHETNSSIDLKIKENISKDSKHLIKSDGIKKDFVKPLEILSKLYGDDDASEVSKIKHVRHAIPPRTVVKQTLKTATTEKSVVTQASIVQKRKNRSTTVTPTTVSTSTKPKKDSKSKKPQTVEKRAKMSAKHSTDRKRKNIATLTVSLHEKYHKRCGNKKNSSTISSTPESVISKMKASKHTKHHQQQNSLTLQRKLQNSSTMSSTPKSVISKIKASKHTKDSPQQNLPTLKQKLHEFSQHSVDVKKKKIVKRSIELPMRGNNNFLDNLYLALSSSKKKELNDSTGSVKNNENDLKNHSAIDALKLNDFNEEEIKYKRPKYKRLMMKQNNIKEKQIFKYNRDKRDVGRTQESSDYDSEILTNQIAMENKKK